MPEDNNPIDPPADEFKAITSQADLDRLIGERLNREKSKYADYDDLKAKAAKFDDAEQANKSELQKEREAREQAERERDTAKHESLRASVAADKGVPASALTGTTKEELEKAADDLIAWRGQKTTKPPVNTLKSGSSNEDDSGLTGKQKAAAALRQMRNSGT